jgi:putative membrane protein insertion efficiency factor
MRAHESYRRIGSYRKTGRTAVAAALHGVYRWTLRPLIAITNPVGTQRCRYYPTCSKYASDAVGSLGLVRGTWLAIRRVGRCHPWSPGGIDEVPTLQTYRWWGIADGANGDDLATPETPMNNSALRGA